MAANLILQYNNSNYIIDRYPDRFGGRQLEYQEESKRIIQKSSDRFKVALVEKQDLENLFHETLDELAKLRNDIAVKHSTKSPHCYGIRRDHEASYQGSCTLTVLTDPYDEYGKKAMEDLHQTLSPMKHTLREIQETQKKSIQTTCLNRRSLTEIEIFTYETMKDWSVITTENFFDTLCRLGKFSAPQGTFDIAWLNNFVKDFNAMQNLKKASIDMYKKIKLFYLVNEIKQIYPEMRKSDYVLATFRLEIDGKMVALSHHFTWLYRDYQEDPFDKMRKKSVIALIHQDPFLIKPMLEEAAKIFKSALEWDGKDLTALKNRVALWTYVFGHAMPFKRGTAAISEWFESAIYLTHSYKLAYNPTKMVNLEILTAPLHRVLSEYDTMILLEEI